MGRGVLDGREIKEKPKWGRGFFDRGVSAFFPFFAESQEA